jgi:hypothetical protein
MPKVEVGAIFQAHEVAAEKYEKAIQSNETMSRALMEKSALEGTLKGCKTQVEVSQEVLDVIISLLRPPTMG